MSENPTPNSEAPDPLGEYGKEVDAHADREKSNTENPTPILEVIIGVRGGVADVDSVPPGVTVIINDYDCEGSDPDHLSDDGDGNQCCRSEYGG